MHSPRSPSPFFASRRRGKRKNCQMAQDMQHLDIKLLSAAEKPMRRTTLCFAFTGLVAGSALAVGPTSTLYAMNYGEFSGGNVVGLDLIQGVTESSFATGNNIDICLAVSGDV